MMNGHRSMDNKPYDNIIGCLRCGYCAGKYNGVIEHCTYSDVRVLRVNCFEESNNIFTETVVGNDELIEFSIGCESRKKRSICV